MEGTVEKGFYGMEETTWKRGEFTDGRGWRRRTQRCIFPNRSQTKTETVLPDIDYRKGFNIF